MPISDVATGLTIVFGTTGFAARIVSVDGPGASRPSIDTTHMATSANRTFMPGDLVDQGEVTITVHHDPSLTRPIATAAETVTITHPIPAGLTVAATWAFSAFCTGYSPSFAIDELMQAQLTLKISGAVTITPAS